MQHYVVSASSHQTNTPHYNEVKMNQLKNTMKRSLAMLMAGVMIAGVTPISASAATNDFHGSVWVEEFASVRPSGSGTANDPFLISTQEHLAWLAMSSRNAHVLLTNDLTITQAIGFRGYRFQGYRVDGSRWYSAARSTFSGVFDGGGHTITLEQHVTERNSDDGSSLGVFSGFANSPLTIQNLTVDGFINFTLDRGSSWRCTCERLWGHMMGYSWLDLWDVGSICLRAIGVPSDHRRHMYDSTGNVLGNIFDPSQLPTLSRYTTQDNIILDGVTVNVINTDYELPEEPWENIFYYVYHDHVVVMDITPPFDYTVVDGRLVIRFHGENDTVNGLEVGDTFAISASLLARSGLAGQVTHISRDATGLTVTADLPTSLDDIFAELHIRQEIYFLQHENVIIELAPHLQGVEGVYLTRNPNDHVVFNTRSLSLYGGNVQISGNVTFYNPYGRFDVQRSGFLGIPQRLNEISFRSNYSVNLHVHTLTNMQFDLSVPLIQVTVPVKYIPLTLEKGFRISSAGMFDFNYRYTNAHVNFGWRRSLSANEEEQSYRSFFNHRPGTHNIDMALRGNAEVVLYAQVSASMKRLHLYGITAEIGRAIEARYTLPQGLTGEPVAAPPPRVSDILRLRSLNPRSSFIAGAWDNRTVGWFSFSRNFASTQPRTITEAMGINIRPSAGVGRELNTFIFFCWDTWEYVELPAWEDDDPSLWERFMEWLPSAFGR